MQTPEELYGSIERIKKAFGIDKPSSTRVRGIGEQLGDSTLLAIAVTSPEAEKSEEGD